MEAIRVFINILMLIRCKRNKAYSLKLGSATVPVYCHMTDDGLGSCGGGGWTLVMKIDGNKVVNSILQLNKHYMLLF